MRFMAIITAMVLCARSQDSLSSMSLRRLHVVFSNVGFKGGGKRCPKTRETAALHRECDPESPPPLTVFFTSSEYLTTGFNMQ